MPTTNLDLGTYQERFSSAGNTMNSVLAPLFALSSISILGIGEFSIEGFSLAATAFGWSGITVSWGALFGIQAVLVAYLINDNDFSDFNDRQSWVAYATAASVILLVLSPPLRNAIAGSQATSWAVFILQLIGFGLIAGIRGDY